MNSFVHINIATFAYDQGNCPVSMACAYASLDHVAKIVYGKVTEYAYDAAGRSVSCAAPAMAQGCACRRLLKY